MEVLELQMEKKKVKFSRSYELNKTSVKPLKGYIGLYLIYLDKTFIQYPFKDSRLIYIGKSDSKDSSIGKRLLDHVSGAGNPAIYNYSRKNRVNFTYLNFELFKRFWSKSIEDLENYFINDFFKNFGCYPICNNKSSDQTDNALEQGIQLEINWNFFCE